MQCKKCNASIDDDSVYCKFCGKKQTHTERKPLKNPNGYGSVINLGSRRHKPWAVRVTDSIKDGKQIYRYISYHATKTEALKALAQEQISPTSPKANLTFAQLYNEWTLTRAFTDISRQTQDNYTACYKHLEPLHNVKFTDIRTSHIQKIIDNLDKSHSTKTKTKLLCGLLYKYAMENDICSKNYSQFVKIEKEDKKEKEVFTDIEIKKLADNNNIEYVDTILILIYTGMRLSEMLSLTKFNVDMTAQTITGGLKTDAGKNRVIPIHPQILPYIKKWYNESDGILFYKDEHKPITANYYRKYIYYPILEQLGLPKRNPHCTRHTCATLLARSGADTNAIKQILGHANYAFTADAYTHVDIDFLKNAINTI